MRVVGDKTKLNHRKASIEQLEKTVPPGATIHWVVRHDAEGKILLDPIYIRRSQHVYLRELVAPVGNWNLNSSSSSLGILFVHDDLKRLMCTIETVLTIHVHPDIESMVFKHVIL